MTDQHGEVEDGSRPASVLPVTCLSHLGITVSDLVVATDFYTRVLGFSQKYANNEQNWARVGLALGDIVIELFSRHPGTDADDSFDPFYPGSFGRPKIALTVPDAGSAFESALSAGITPRCSITETSVSKFFFITDPDGTLIQLQEFSGGRSHLSDLFP